VGSVPLTELSSQANCQVLLTNQLGNLPAAVTIGAGNPLVVATPPHKAEVAGMRVSCPCNRGRSEPGLSH